MVRDRLPELLQRSHSVSSNGWLNETNLIMEYGGKQSIADILKPYSEVRYNLRQISNNLDAMVRMTHTINLRNFNQTEMNDLRNDNLSYGNALLNRFKEFKAELPADNDYSLEARMKRTLFHGLYQSYINLWERHEEFLQNYERRLKMNLQMHSKIINCNATEDEVEELIANKSTNLFVGNILEETEKERKTLRDLMDRFSELRKLEKAIEDVHALFMRIQTLVMEQGEIVQRAEFHAQQATIYMDRGADELEKAEKCQKKARKRKLVLLAILVIVLLILVYVGVYL